MPRHKQIVVHSACRERTPGSPRFPTHRFLHRVSSVPHLLCFSCRRMFRVPSAASSWTEGVTPPWPAAGLSPSPQLRPWRTICLHQSNGVLLLKPAARPGPTTQPTPPSRLPEAWDVSVSSVRHPSPSPPRCCVCVCRGHAPHALTLLPVSEIRGRASAHSSSRPLWGGWAPALRSVVAWLASEAWSPSAPAWQ